MTAHTLDRPAPQMAPEPAAWKADELRPNWRTVRRHPDLRLRPQATAAADADCPGCGSEVLEHEPILCVGAYLAAHEDGTRTVDMSGCEWRCQRCTTIFQPGGVH